MCLYATLCDNQHGFRKMRSCESQLIQFVDELARSLVGGRQVDVAVMDFSKAFDVVGETGDGCNTFQSRSHIFKYG